MGMFLGAKCDGCWERIENCTCEKYVPKSSGSSTSALEREVSQLTDEVRQLRKLLEKLGR